MSLRWLKLDEKRLSQQWIFRLAIAIPFGISLLLCIPLWFETTFDFSSAGYAKFLSIFSLPIGVLSLSIPLVAIVAHIHRTIQTEVEIELINQKNVSERFHSHQKYVTESLSFIKGNKIQIRGYDIKLEISDPYSLYRDFFPNSSPDNGIILDTKESYALNIIVSLSDINKNLEKTYDYINKNKEVNVNILAMNLLEVILDMSNIKRFLSINKTEIELIRKNKEILFLEDNRKYNFSTYFFSEKELKSYLEEIRSISYRVLYLLDIENNEYYTHINRYIVEDEHNYFSMVFEKMKDTGQSRARFVFGESAFTPEKFEKFNSFLSE
ncbi:hypothetical protein [Pectobacterium sp. CHL-2024]|uniref:hypothetical protein n=1 Tax=Pectobacterium sp. CHL-2024 TaxID=3377079 RepID=UPI00380C7DD5